MRRALFLTIALCMAVTASFAQSKAVAKANSVAKGDKNFAEARELIKGALTDAETKDDPKTWYVAGFIEDQQFSAERMKEMLGQTPNQAVMYESLLNTLPYFEKGLELDQKPDAKGKVKPKYTKDIKGILGANRLYYINGGAYYFDQKDYRKAYQAFEQYLKISDMPIFQDTEAAARDSNFMTVQYYSAVAATQLEEPQTAIAALERAKNTDYRLNEVYQFLYSEYDQLKDTANMERTLKEGMEKVPEEPYFLLNLINIYIYSGRNADAVEYLKQAILKNPKDAMLYNALGSVYEDGLKDFENAEQNFKKALEIDPEYADALANLGRIYYNRAINLQGEANMLSDNKQYQEALANAKSFFEKSRPYFETAHRKKPDERTYLIALRGIYYNLNMGKEFEEIEALLEK